MGGGIVKLITVSYNPSDSLYINSWGSEDISQNAHWGRGCRNVFILHYILSGEGFFNGNKVKEGEGFLITPQSMHEYHSSQDKPWKYFWVTFSGDLAKEICIKHIETDKNGRFEYSFKEKLLKLADGILSEESPLSGVKALGYFFLLMSYHGEKCEGSSNRYISEAKKYMQINFHRNLSITEVAKFLSISDRYLYNLFVKHDRISPKEYLNNLKIKHAELMLKNSSCSVSEVAVSVGFSDVLTFSRFFSKKTGMSPTEYRKINIKN